MKYLIVMLLAGCSLSASVDTNNYDCNETDKDKMSAFVLDCYKADSNNMSMCLTTAKKVYCRKKGIKHGAT